MAATPSLSRRQPQVSGTGSYSPLEQLVQAALRRVGDFSRARVDGDMMMMAIGLANDVIDELRVHPYWEGGDVPYYTSQSDTRPIPDSIVLVGLVFGFEDQKMSKKAPVRRKQFERRLNQALYHLKYGGSQRLLMAPMDNGSAGLPEDS